ncbi:MAG: efflux RND transporter periplasmic adaptor subunit [Candidatus Brocadiia bacterium]
MKGTGKKLLIGIALLIVGGGVIVSISSMRRTGSGSGELPTARVSRSDFSNTVLATGEVNPKVGAKVKVGARISGKVEKLYANIGDEVKKGETIALLERDEQKSVVKQNEAELEKGRAKLAATDRLGPIEIEKAESEVDRMEATLHQAERHLERQKQLVSKDFTSEEEVDRAEEQLRVAEAQLSAAQKTLKLAHSSYEEELKQDRAEVRRVEAAVANAEARLRYATITAPISGVIGTVTTQEGETVAAGLSAPTFVEIIDLERLEVDAFVDEVDIGKIKVGQEAHFSVDAFPDRTFDGYVRAIYPDAVIQDNVVYYDVVIEIEDDYAGLLRPQMTTNVTIFQQTREDVLSVAASAVHREEGQQIVYVMDGKTPQKRTVETGERQDGDIEILNGLREGEEVLLELPPN